MSDFFQDRINLIIAKLATKPTHAPGPKKPTMTEQESKGNN